MTEPLKRHHSLQPLSREHHHGLLLAWKIRTGQQNGVSSKRIGNYVLWFWENILRAHFDTEEKYVFPLLEYHNPLVLRAKAEHKKIENLIKGDMLDNSLLAVFERELVNHIRFEERELFTRIQDKLSSEDLEAIQLPAGNDVNPDAWDDNFWQKNNPYMKNTLYILAMFAFHFGCGDQSTETLQDLTQDEVQLKNELQEMRDSIEDTWDHVNEIISNNLPIDMPPKEKENMLKVRNARLIRMFQSFDDLEPEIKKTVDSAEAFDNIMSQRIVKIRRQLEEIEEEKYRLSQPSD